MKILFICGSLEPGRDGVGDYTRRLACELIRQEHEIKAISISERHLDQDIKEAQSSEGIDLQVLRLPSDWPKNKSLLNVKIFIENFNPQWISLQFVPYSFHKKGIPWGFVKLMSSLGKQYRYHIMFHEIWIDSDGKIKSALIRQIQKLIIKRLVAALKPELINVSIPYNQLKLQQLNISSRVLGLFGNIPPEENADFLVKLKNEELETIHILYFGAAPRGEFKMQILKGLADFCIRSSSKIKILVVSGYSNLKDEFIFSLNESVSNHNVKILDLGFLEINELSNLLKTCNVGIVRSVPNLLGKSSSAISMLEHGLPIWMPKLKCKSDVIFDFRPKLIFNCLETAISYKNKPKPYSLLPKVAKEFIFQLKL